MKQISLMRERFTTRGHTSRHARQGGLRAVGSDFALRASSRQVIVVWSWIRLRLAQSDKDVVIVRIWAPLILFRSFVLYEAMNRVLPMFAIE